MRDKPFRESYYCLEKECRLLGVEEGDALVEMAKRSAGGD